MVNFALTSVWNDITKNILRGRSIIVSAPRYFGKSTFLKRFLCSESVKELYELVRIDFGDSKVKYVNYNKVWNCLKEKTTESAGELVKNKTSFIRALSKIKTVKPILVMIECNHNNKNLVIELINNFQEIAHKHPKSFEEQIVLMVIDDLSLYFYELTPQSKYSTWDMFFSKIKLSCLPDAGSVQGILKSNKTFTNYADTYGNIILKITGGHHGLTYLALEFLIQNINNCDLRGWDQECRMYLQNTNIMSSIHRFLLIKDMDYLERALNFKEKRMPDSLLDQIIVDLHQQGIVLIKDTIYSQLCPGIVSELLEGVYIERVKKQNGDCSNISNLISNHPQSNLLQGEKEEFVKKIRELVVTSDMNELFDAIRIFIGRHEQISFADNLRLLNGRYNTVEINRISGTIADNDYLLELGKIRRSILQVLKLI